MGTNCFSPDPADRRLRFPHYTRALHLASPHCPGFPAVPHGLSTEALFQALKNDLTALEPAAAQHYGNALLNTFTDLVASMIGEELMAQILGAAWVGSSHGNT